MSCSESTVEEATLTWFEELAYSVGSGPIYLRPIAVICPLDNILIAFETAVQRLLKYCLPLRKESRPLAILRDIVLRTPVSGKWSMVVAVPATMEVSA
jgi:hypothetical protein